MNPYLKLKYYSLLEELKEFDYLISVIAYGVAPTLTGEKPSSLIGFTNRRRNLLILWNKYKDQACEKLGIKYCELKNGVDKSMVLFYKEEALTHCISSQGCAGFLRKMGYDDNLSLEDKLDRLKERFKAECPHEVGIFLGIPVEDVEGFIENHGEAYLFYKYWKVYHNPKKAYAMFRGFDKAKETIVLKIEEMYVQGEQMVKGFV